MVHFLRLSTNGVVVVGAVVRFKFLSRDFLQTITFGNTLLSNLFFFSSPTPFRCCVHNETFGLALRIFFFFFKKTKMENFIFSSEISYGLSILRKQSKMNRSSWRIHVCASGSSCRIVIDDPGKKKKNPKMIQWVFVERIIAVEKIKITFRPFGIK